jgi:hypothetical protein
LAVGALGYRTYSLLNVPGQPTEAEWGMQDFRDAIYYPVVAFLEGNNPYDTRDYLAKYPVRQPFPLYSPLTLVVHLPLGLLSFEAAELVYFVVTVLLCVALAYLSFEFSGVRPHAWQVLAVGALILISRPGHKNLVLGQTTLQAVLFSLIALQYARRRPVAAGLALGLATFKPTFGVPLFVLMWCRRDYRACLYALAIGGGATLILIGALAARAGGLGPLVGLIPANNAAFVELPGASPLTGYARIDFAALISRVVGQVPSGAFELAAALALLALTGTMLFRTVPGNVDEGAAGLSGTLICLTILLAIYHQAYDLLLLVPAFMATIISSSGGWHTPGQRRVLLGCYVVLATNYLATATAIRVLNLDGVFWTLVASINGVALVVAYALCAWQANTTSRTSA